MSLKKVFSTGLLVPVMCLALASGTALAGEGKSNGKSDTRGNSGAHANSDTRGKSGTYGRGNGHGGKGSFASAFSKFSSELKWMNSAHSNQNARDHAAENSRPGRDGAYLVAALATQDTYTALLDANPDLAEAANEMTLEEANELLANASDPEDQHNNQLLVDYLSAQEAEAEALDAASDGLTLSDTALNAYRSLLGV